MADGTSESSCRPGIAICLLYLHSASTVLIHEGGGGVLTYTTYRRTKLEAYPFPLKARTALKHTCGVDILCALQHRTDACVECSFVHSAFAGECAYVV